MIAELRQLFPDGVFVKIPTREKGPGPGWQNLRLADMTPEYLRGFEGNGPVNIGVVLGPETGGFATIDCDDDAEARRFHDLNPKLRGTLISRGERGYNFWIRPTGAVPAGSFKLNTKDGRRFGEWRWRGNQTVVAGIHPCGLPYRRWRAAVLEVDFDEIVWPEHLILPWVENNGAPADRAAEPDDPYAEDPPESVEAIHARLRAERHSGLIYKPGEKSSPHVNLAYAAQYFHATHKIVYDVADGRFYLYDSNTGEWEFMPEPQLGKVLHAWWSKVIAEFDGHPLLVKMDGPSLISCLIQELRRFAAFHGVWKRLDRIIHAGNLMIHINDDLETVTPRKFSSKYMSRNRIPIDYDPKAKCPKTGAYLAGALPPYDQSLAIRFMGNVLLTGNRAHRILLLTGNSGTGKTVLSELIRDLVGRQNTIEIRPSLLHERFEIGRYYGKTLLVCPEAKAGILESQQAQALKKLSGHDQSFGEIKGSMESLPISGDFAIVLVSNEALHVNLEGETDIAAWRRRLMIIQFEGEPPACPIDDYWKILLQEEGPGILNLALQGAMAHLRELRDRGNFVLTDEQNARVDKLLAESESVKFFVRRCLCLDRKYEGTTTRDLVEAYYGYCTQMGWAPLASKTVERTMPDLILKHYGVACGTHMTGNGQKRVRGYPHIKLREGEEDDQPDEPDPF